MAEIRVQLNVEGESDRDATWPEGTVVYCRGTGKHYKKTAGETFDEIPGGAQGIPGPQGIQGETGLSGAQGVPGLSGADGLQGPPGNTGSQGPQGIPGTNGQDGVAGSQGIQGLAGGAGPQGNQGIQGVLGNDGAPGAQGQQGIPGNDGAQGQQGIQGIQGVQGNPGTPGTPGGLMFHVQALTSSPGDGATIYFGMLPKAPVTAAGTSKVYVRKSCTIKVAEIYCYSGTAGTNEAWSLYIRKNNTTDTLIATLNVSASERVFSNASLSIAMSVGDYFEIKGVQPTWGTNPLTTIYAGYIYAE